jgi:hypothetical protein
VLPLDARRAASLSARNGIGIGSQDVRNFRGHRAVLRTYELPMSRTFLNVRAPQSPPNDEESRKCLLEPPI